MRVVVALLLTLATITERGAGEIFPVPQASVVREEDSNDLDVLSKPLLCEGIYPDFFIGNEEPVPFEVVSIEDFFVNLRFTRPPDTELGDEFYRVFIVCDDGYAGFPPATATVSVTITSRNEHLPYAPLDSYSIAFSEAVEGGSVVGSAGPGTNQYLIVDEDGGVDGVLTYTSLDDPPNPYITLDPESGDLLLISQLDYEKEGALTTSIQINGCDQLTPTYLCPNITIHFTLTSVNDNDPQFLQSEYWGAIEEGLHRASVLVSNITCTDADIAEGAYAGIEVVSSTLDFIEIVASEMGVATLLVTAALDYDFTNNTQFEAELRCYDDAQVGAMRNATAAVYIAVLPGNDHSPAFMSAWFNTTVLESLAVGSSLLTASCTDQDRDYGQFAAITFHQPSPLVNETFHIDPTTGLVTLIGPLDYDNPTTRHHIFTIRCCDEGGREALSRISIATLPVGDEPVTLQYPVTYLTVNRLTSVDSKIGQVIAIDGDEGEVAAIIYTLEYSDLFDIDDEGYIILTDYLDREKGDFFNLTVEVRDGQGADKGQVEISVKGLFSILGIINVVIGTFGLLVVIIITAMVAVCSYCCWKLYRRGPSETVTNVPVRYMRGDQLPIPRRPRSAHSRGSSQLHYSGTLRDRRTLSMKRTKKKKQPRGSFKRRPKQRPAIGENNFFTNIHTDLDDEHVLFGQNPEEGEMTLFKNEDAEKGGGDEWLEEEEAVDSTHNIFNPEDAGLMLGDIMLFPGEQQTRWDQGDSENNSVVDMGSWALMADEEPKMSKEGDERGEGAVSESESEGSGEWDPATGIATWDPDETDSLTLTTI